QGAPSQWGNLAFNNSTSATQLSNTTIRFGQQVSLASASPQFNSVTISSMSVRAILADIGSFPSGSGNQAFGSPLNGIELPGGVSINQIRTWGLQGIPYVIHQGRIFVDTGGVLTLAPGVIVKFQRRPGDASEVAQAGLAVLRGGSLVTQGTAQAPVIFTSLKDDTV